MVVPVRGGQHLILSAGVQTTGGRWDIALVQIPCGEPAQVWTSMNQVSPPPPSTLKTVILCVFKVFISSNNRDTSIL